MLIVERLSKGGLIDCMIGSKDPSPQYSGFYWPQQSMTWYPEMCLLLTKSGIIMQFPASASGIASTGDRFLELRRRGGVQVKADRLRDR